MYSTNKNNFHTAAMILGIISIVTMCTIFLPPVLGALGILFVVLGKRRGQKLGAAGISGLITSLTGIAGGVVMTVLIFVSAIAMLAPENRDSLNRQFEDVYGFDFDEYMEYMYGEDFDDYLEQFDSLYE